jgi:hypothetical protein
VHPNSAGKYAKVGVSENWQQIPMHINSKIYSSWEHHHKFWMNEWYGCLMVLYRVPPIFGQDDHMLWPVHTTSVAQEFQVTNHLDRERSMEGPMISLENKFKSS